MTQLLDLLGGVLDRFEARPGQQVMAEAVAQALANQSDLLVEAGTGTGKTLAYLLPILASGRRAILSTATRHLQSQLVEHDIPLALRATGLQRAVAVLKGRSNYLCRQRIERAMQAVPQGAPAPQELLAIEQVARTSPHGDRAEVYGVDETHAIWPEVTSTADNCLGSACPQVEACFLLQARRRAVAADIAVVNHALLLADYAVRERWEAASLLPSAGVLVLDEAHALPDIATSFFGASLAERRFWLLVRDMRKNAPLLLDGSLRQAVLDALDDIDRRVAALYDVTRTLNHQAVLSQDVRDRLEPTAALLEGALGWLQDLLAHEEPAADPAWQKATEAVYASRGDLDRLLFARDTPGEPMVRWVEHRGRESVLVAQPIEVGPILARTLLAEPAVRIFTSATLTLSGRFDHIRDRLGLLPETTSLTVPGGFDYARQALLYVPVGVPDPFQPKREEAVAAHVEQLAIAAAGGTFALFSSFRAMRDAAERLRPRLPMTCLMQGEQGKEQLLERFVHEQPAVLFATMGFWQGIDLPQGVLRVVMLDKIPFPPPDDPLFAARSARCEADGQSSFQALSLPMAAISLRQGFGRLVRSRRHWGIVAILDGRLTSKAYGRQLLDSLPPARRAGTFAEVLEFLADRLAGEIR
jgi:ATP-dependent DNA helicase DinG